MIPLAIALLIAVLAALSSTLLVLAARRARARAAAEERLALERETRAILETAESEARALRSKLELDAKTAQQDARRRLEEESAAADVALSNRIIETERRGQELEARAGQLGERVELLAAREQELSGKDEAAKALRDEAHRLGCECASTLEKIAGETPAELKQRLVADWIEDAKAAAAEHLRRIEASVTDAEHARTGKRVMDIAIQRYYGHYLTERLLTNLPIVPDTLPRIIGERNEHLNAIQEVSHVTLTVSDSGEAIRLEGQDSFGREIARRAITRFAKNAPRGDARKLVEQIAEELGREVFEMGKRAFKELEIPRAHPDIVKLVGKLNYRTSYTQNQWKHAVESAFLCGMMADEMGLDVKVARRAALMHDIGKALSHEMEGSHAVIGADIARRLGETEVVANAIGAHHTEEPFNSTFAYLVAAADALSGGRPGARRQQDENYMERIHDLERIAGEFKGVDRVYAVQGGREVRVLVQEGRVNDERAVILSGEIAQRISDEMIFPGQIKVTVIREVKAVATAS